MFGKPLNPLQVKTILLISLSNIGDIILTCPVLDILLKDFPSAKINVVVGPRGKTLFDEHPRIQAIVYDKSMNFGQIISWIQARRDLTYDLIVDLRNTMIPFLLRASKRTWPHVILNHQSHAHLKHLQCLKNIWVPLENRYEISSIFFSLNLQEQLIKHLGFHPKGVGVIVPLAADDNKSWPDESMKVFCSENFSKPLLVLGAASQKDRIDAILKGNSRVINLAGQTDVRQAAWLISQAAWALVPDSGMLHVASYLTTPTVALFGPTNPQIYGPWGGGRSKVIRKNSNCQQCLRPQDGSGHTCMSAISVEDVLNAVNEIQQANT